MAIKSKKIGKIVHNLDLTANNYEKIIKKCHQKDQKLPQKEPKKP